MKNIFFLVVLLCLINSGLGLIGHRLWKIKQKVEEARELRARQLLARNGPNVETYYLEQPLDHFNGLSKVLGKTYQQRYYVNKEFWSGPDSPVFLFIGGEGTLSDTSIALGEIVDLAKEHGALLVGAEHRFYGRSLNDDGLQLEEMQYLSSQQALADLATFVQHIQDKYTVSPKAQWICFGGSYPGALSAWFRLKYPHLVHAAVASSAPVRAITNFEGYNEVVAASLASKIVGGSDQCLSSVIKAFKVVDQLIHDKQLDQLAKDFLSCAPISEKMDIVTFVSNLAGGIEGIVQYNNELPGANISHICKVMTQPSEPYQNLIQLNKELMEISKEDCVDNSYYNYTMEIMNTTVKREDLGPGIRQWTYQTCTQFGYYQTCDTKSCPFSQYLDLDDTDIHICQTVFKINPEDVPKNVRFTNDYYGSNNTQQSKIIFVNGSIDPWHWLSILKNEPVFDIYGVYIEGTAHCANMLPEEESDPVALKMARKEISSLVSKFLQEPFVAGS